MKYVPALSMRRSVSINALTPSKRTRGVQMTVKTKLR
jgi:hypothetical protein